MTPVEVAHAFVRKLNEIEEWHSLNSEMGRRSQDGTARSIGPSGHIHRSYGARTMPERIVRAWIAGTDDLSFLSMAVRPGQSIPFHIKYKPRANSAETETISVLIRRLTFIDASVCRWELSQVMDTPFEPSSGAYQFFQNNAEFRDLPVRHFAEFRDVEPSSGRPAAPRGLEVHEIASAIAADEAGREWSDGAWERFSGEYNPKPTVKSTLAPIVDTSRAKECFSILSFLELQRKEAMALSAFRAIEHIDKYTESSLNNSPGAMAFAISLYLSINLLNLPMRGKLSEFLPKTVSDAHKFAPDLFRKSLRLGSVEFHQVHLDKEDAPNIFEVLNESNSELVTAFTVQFGSNSKDDDSISTASFLCTQKTRRTTTSFNPLISLIAVNGKKPEALDSTLVGCVTASFAESISKSINNDNSLAMQIAEKLIQVAATMRSTEEIDAEAANLLNEDGSFKKQYCLSSEISEERLCDFIKANDLTTVLLV